MMSPRPPRRLQPAVALTLTALVAAMSAGCAKARPKLFDRDRAMQAAPIAKAERQEVLDGSLLDGLNKLRRGDLKAARVAFADHLRDHPKSAMAHYHLGLVAMDEDRFDEARGYLERALRLEPQLYGAASNLGVLYLRNGELNAAMRRLEEAESIAPGDPRVQINFGNARLRRGLWSEAVESYTDANAKVKGHASLMYNLAVAWCERHRYAEALKLLDEAIMYRPGFQLARALRVHALHGLGRVDQAIAAADKSLAEVEPTSDLQIVRGRALLARGRIEEGVAALQTAVELDGDDGNALLALGEALDATGKRKRAAELYRRFLKTNARRLDDSRRVRRRLRQLGG